MYTFRSYYIPDRMMKAIQRYLSYGLEPGDFLTAIIENNFVEAAGRADEENLNNLPAYAAFLYAEVPVDAWGSREKRLAWQANRQAEFRAHGLSED